MMLILMHWQMQSHYLIWQEVRHWFILEQPLQAQLMPAVTLLTIWPESVFPMDWHCFKLHTHRRDSQFYY